LKKIAITQRLVLNESYYEIRETLDIRWGEVFKKLGFLPIILPIEIEFEQYFDNMDIDGIMLTGGNDLTIVNNNKLSLKRDTFEKKLIDYAIKKQIPLFGVCRGMQIIANYFNLALTKVENQVAVRHKLFGNKDSKYYNLISELYEVNSFHNYALKDVTNDFIVSASNEIGTIKAIEHRNYKIFAQMWHTERETPLNKSELDIIKYFFESK